MEEKQWVVKDTKSLHNALLQLKEIEPTHRRIILNPQENSSTEDVVRWMDVISKDPKGKPLFPEIIIEPAQ